MARIFRAAAFLLALGLIPTAAGAKAPVPVHPQPTAVATARPTPRGKAAGTTATPQAAALSDTGPAVVDRKQVALADLLAVVPGIVVHGSGHMYAGAWMHGLGLFAIEGACVAVGYDSVRRGVDSYNAMNNAGGIPTNLSPLYTDAGVAVVTGLGFLWTWWDDMAGAGIAAHEYNQRHAQAADVGALQMHLQPARGGALLALSTRF